MSLIRELLRVARSAFTFALAEGRVLVLGLVVLAAVLVVTVTTVTVVGHVALYPFV